MGLYAYIKEGVDLHRSMRDHFDDDLDAHPWSERRVSAARNAPKRMEPGCTSMSWFGSPSPCIVLVICGSRACTSASWIAPTPRDSLRPRKACTPARRTCCTDGARSAFF